MGWFAKEELDESQAPPVEPGDVPAGLARATFAAGCFWGVEDVFRQVPGVVDVVSGYTGGDHDHPTYRQVCSGRTGHAEAVLVVWDPAVTGYDELLKTFWESHDPTQGMRQGNDIGTQYRSAIFVTDQDQLEAAKRSMDAYNQALSESGYPPITTEVAYLPEGGFYYAEDYHQQYLAKNPGGYCGLGGTGVSCPVGTGVHAEHDPGSPA